MAMGAPGCLSIFGRKAVQHGLFAEHLTAEYRVRTEGRGRTGDEYRLPVRKLDNHWFDCLVRCIAVASMKSVERIGAEVKSARQRERLKLSSLRRKSDCQRGGGWPLPRKRHNTQQAHRLRFVSRTGDTTHAQGD